MSRPIAAGLTQAESDFLGHLQMFGSEGYPIQKISRGWLWVEMFEIKGAPTVYKTKRAAFAAVSAYLNVLIEKCAEAKALEAHRELDATNPPWAAAYTEKLEGMDYDSLTDDERGWLNCRRAYLASID